MLYCRRYHTHNLQRPASYYLDPIPLPPEDLEPIQEKPVRSEIFIIIFDDDGCISILYYILQSFIIIMMKGQKKYVINVNSFSIYT